MSGSKEFHDIIECDLQHNVPEGVQPKFADTCQFKDSNVHNPGLATDPTGVDFGNQEGGFYYNNDAKRFKYKGGDPVLWRFFGDGDGDVKYDDTGPTAKADNAIPRWSSLPDGNWIQGSLVTISDTGAMLNPARYTSRSATANDTAFMAETTANNFDLRIYNDGRIRFKDDITLERPSTQYLTLDGTDTEVELTGTGNTRLSARKHLSALGNNPNLGNNFRAPAMHQYYAFYQTPAAAAAPSITPLSYNPYNYQVPPNALATDGDSLTWTIFFETGGSTLLKRFAVTFDGDTVLGSIAGGASHAGIAIIRLIRQTSNQALLTLTGTYDGTLGGSVLGSPFCQIFRTGFDFLASFDIILQLQVVGDNTTPFAEGEFKHNAATIEYKCF